MRNTFGHSDIEALKNWVKENRSHFNTTQTRSGVNHNRSGQYSKAYHSIYDARYDLLPKTVEHDLKKYPGVP